MAAAECTILFEDRVGDEWNGVSVTVVHWKVTEDRKHWGDTVLRCVVYVDHKLEVEKSLALPIGIKRENAIRLGIAWYDWAVRGHPLWGDPEHYNPWRPDPALLPAGWTRPE